MAVTSTGDSLALRSSATAKLCNFPSAGTRVERHLSTKQRAAADCCVCDSLVASIDGLAMIVLYISHTATTVTAHQNVSAALDQPPSKCLHGSVVCVTCCDLGMLGNIPMIV